MQMVYVNVLEVMGNLMFVIVVDPPKLCFLICVWNHHHCRSCSSLLEWCHWVGYVF